MTGSVCTAARRLPAVCCALHIALLAALLPAHLPADDSGYSVAIEKQLNAIFQAIRESDLPAAGSQAERLVEQYPDFALGQLLYAELMMARGMKHTLIDSEQAFSPRLLELIMEAQSRVRQSTIALDNTRLPDNLLQIGRDIEHIVAVDLEFSRLYLVKNQNQRSSIVAHHYAASGRGGYGKLLEGDLRTPTGVYRVTEFKPETSLPDLYGAGALTLDYPNALDRHYKRTGSGIWLHGMPRENLSRAPRSSEGCVVMPNDLLVDLSNTLKLDSTLVLLSGTLHWQTRQQLQQSSGEFIALFNHWRQAWLSNDLAALGELQQQPLFQRTAHGRSSFKGRKLDLNGLAGVSVDDITIIRYPVLPDLIPTAQPRQSPGGSRNRGETRQTHPQVMMQFALPEAKNRATALAQRITLYWERGVGRQWHIVQIKQHSAAS